MIRFMNSPKLFLLLCLIILLIARINGQDEPPFFCSPVIYAQGSTFQRNVQSVLSSLSSNANQSDGFYNTTAGLSDDTVWGIFQCLGHATVLTCEKCVSDGVKDIIQRCPNQKGAVSWYDNCWIHFSGDAYFFNILNDGPGTTLANIGSATDTTSFMNMLTETLGVVVEEASKGGRKKFATRENHSAFEPLYTLAQCTPDLTGSDCLNCLKISVGDLLKCCKGKVAAVALKPSCYLRYDIYAFYQQAPPPPPSPAPSKDKSKISAGISIAIVVPTALFILQASLCFLCLKYLRARMNSTTVPKTGMGSAFMFRHKRGRYSLYIKLSKLPISEIHNELEVLN